MNTYFSSSLTLTTETSGEFDGREGTFMFGKRFIMKCLALISTLMLGAMAFAPDVFHIVTSWRPWLFVFFIFWFFGFCAEMSNGF